MANITVDTNAQLNLRMEEITTQTAAHADYITPKLKQLLENDSANSNSVNSLKAYSEGQIDTLSVEVAATKKSVSDGKTAVAAAITRKKIPTAADASFAQMATNIDSIISGAGNAVAADVLAGKTFTNSTGVETVGAMANRGAVSSSLNAGGSYNVPVGYHNGSGTITANPLSGQTSGTATPAQILTGQTAWVEGNKITGTMANRGAIAQALSINGTYTVPAGYHNGSGKVTQSIATIGAQTITPSTTTQTVPSSGRYMTGNVTVNPIPSNYINVNNSQTVFDSGSYGLLAPLGAYNSSSRYWLSNSMTEATFNTGTQLHNVRNDGFSSPSPVIFFRNMFSSSFKYIDVTWLTGTSMERTMHIIISNGIGGNNSIIEVFAVGISGTERTVTANLTGLALTSDFALAFYTYNPNWVFYIRKVALRAA